MAYAFSSLRNGCRKEKDEQEKGGNKTSKREEGRKQKNRENECNCKKRDCERKNENENGNIFHKLSLFIISILIRFWVMKPNEFSCDCYCCRCRCCFCYT